MKEISKEIKKKATKQKIRINLTAEQIKALKEQVLKQNPKKPAEIAFYVAGKDIGNIKAAGYWYAGDTCCV